MSVVPPLVVRTANIVQDCDPESDMIVPQQGDTSPKALELKQFDAYLKRELPRKIRKELEAAMERIMGPMEETLQRQLEDIVRDCHENLTRSYCSAAQPTDAIPGEIAGPSRATERSEFASLPMLDEPALDTHSTTLQADALSQYNVSPESSPQLWPDMMQPPDNFLTEATWSDSVYFSQFESLGYPILDGTWPPPTTTEPLFEDNRNTDTSGNYRTMANPVFTHSHDQPPLTAYTGKGKERAVDFCRP
jgi:hypothetical protein